MSEKFPQKNIYHPDILIFLIIIPFINAFNYYLTYSKIRLNWFLLVTFTIDTLLGYVAWWAIRSFILLLDKKLPFENGFAKRLMLQLAGTLFIAIFIISAITEIISFIATGKSAPLSFYTVDLFIISTWFFVLNGIYIALYYYNLWRQSEDRRLEENLLKADGVRVRQGKQDILLAFDEVSGFFVDSDYAVVCNRDGKKFYIDQSLDKIEKTLPFSLFFRLNRQYILHRNIISGFTRAENGKILVTPLRHECFQNEILVSRIKAPAFKIWFKGKDVEN